MAQLLKTRSRSLRKNKSQGCLSSTTFFLFPMWSWSRPSWHMWWTLQEKILDTLDNTAAFEVLRAPHPSSLPPFEPPTLRAPNPSGPQPFGPPPLRAPTRSGPHPFGPPPVRAPLGESERGSIPTKKIWDGNLQLKTRTALCKYGGLQGGAVLLMFFFREDPRIALVCLIPIAKGPVRALR